MSAPSRKGAETRLRRGAVQEGQLGSKGLDASSDEIPPSCQLLEVALSLLRLGSGDEKYVFASPSTGEALDLALSIHLETAPEPVEDIAAAERLAEFLEREGGSPSAASQIRAALARSPRAVECLRKKGGIDRADKRALAALELAGGASGRDSDVPSLMRLRQEVQDPNDGMRQFLGLGRTRSRRSGRDS